MNEHYHVINNPDLQHFEFFEGNEIAVPEYKFYKKDIAFMHTEVPQSMIGKGIASLVAKHAFNYAKQVRKAVMVYCRFVANFVKRYPEYNEQLDKEFQYKH